MTHSLFQAEHGDNWRVVLQYGSDHHNYRIVKEYPKEDFEAAVQLVILLNCTAGADIEFDFDFDDEE